MNSLISFTQRTIPSPPPSPTTTGPEQHDRRDSTMFVFLPQFLICLNTSLKWRLGLREEGWLREFGEKLVNFARLRWVERCWYRIFFWLSQEVCIEPLPMVYSSHKHVQCQRPLHGHILSQLARAGSRNPLEPSLTALFPRNTCSARDLYTVIYHVALYPRLRVLHIVPLFMALTATDPI